MMCFSLRILMIGLFFISLFPVSASAERVKALNPDCEVCPVVISFDSVEAREILGKEGLALIKKFENLDYKSIKIDLDGKKKVGSEKDPDDGYELLINANKHSIVFIAIQDASDIKIRTDAKQSAPKWDINTWSPRIELRPAQSIDKSEPLDFAWDKMKASRMYGYVNKGIDHRKWNAEMKTFLIHMLEELNKQI